MNIHTLTEADFLDLPLVTLGESKEIRDAGRDEHGQRICVIRFRPTIYSFTANRTALVPGSDSLRLRATKVLVDVIKAAGIDHAYREVGERFVLADLIEDPPNIEVVIKEFHGGTSKHRYLGMNGSKVRENHPLYANVPIRDEDAYPHTLVRFDWRNPFWHPDKVRQSRLCHPNLPAEVFEWPDHLKSYVRVADECLPDSMADWFIDTTAARHTALRTYRALSTFLADRDIVIHDLCLFVTSDGKKVFGEISQDCGRFRHFDLGSLDKDVWRGGGSAEDVLAKWRIMAELVERA